MWTGYRVVIYCPGPKAGGLVYTPARAQHKKVAGPIALSGFDPLSFTVAGSNDWWVLGSVLCQQTRVCPAMLRTTAGGAHFGKVAAPQARISVVGQLYKDLGLRFADVSHGWVFGPGLWSSNNGGVTWTNDHVQGTVMDVEAASAQVYALVCPEGLSACAGKENTEELIRAPVGSRLAGCLLASFLALGLEPCGAGWHGRSDERAEKNAATVVVSTDGAAASGPRPPRVYPGSAGLFSPLWTVAAPSGSPARPGCLPRLDALATTAAAGRFPGPSDSTTHL